MKKIKVIFLVLFIVSALLSAFYWLLFTDSKDLVYKGLYKSEPVIVKLVTKQGFIKNTFSHSVQLGDLKPINIDWNSTDSKGIPYDKSIFGTSKSTFIDNSFTYENELTFDSFKTITMLYISKTDFTLEEYLIYEDFFKNYWPIVQQELLNQENGFYTHIVGVVYGNKQDFVKVFKGVYKNKIFSLTITPDGEINLNPTGNTMLSQNSGLSNKIQMPGKIIFKKLNQINYSPNYDTFKDQNGKFLKDYFKIEIEKVKLKK